MKSLLLIFLAFSTGCLSAQTAKGGTVQNNEVHPTGISRAVVVGISKYLEVKPELQFADRDAVEFSKYLQSKSGGNISAENIKLLTNENATTANIILALEWLKKESQINDRAIIYFSGHGDVETLTEAQNGYLLTYNSPKQVYIAGALPVYILKDYISTLSNKNVSVLMISDACHSGKLAGGEEGVRSANAAIMNKWSKEVKILSAQPNQLSLESRDWGNGRGVFSFYLVNGLYGMADKDGNGKVTISELENYVNENVVKDSRQTQEPVFDAASKFTSVIGNPDANEKEVAMREMNSNSSVAYNPSSGKSSYESILKSLSLEAQQIFAAFQKALDENKLISSDNNSAKYLFEKLKASSDNAQVNLMAEQNLTAALLNDVQLVINKYLEGKKFLRRNDFATAYEKMKTALQFVPKEHPLLNSLHAQSLFLQAASLTDMWSDTIVNKKEIQHAIALLDSAKKILPNAAYIFQIEGEMYYQLDNMKKATENYLRAHELSPKWIYPIYDLGGVNYTQHKYAKAKEYLEQAISIDSTMHTLQCTKCAIDLLGDIYFDQNKPALAIEKYNIAIAIDSSMTKAYFSAAEMLCSQKKYDEAKKYANKLFIIDSSEAWEVLGMIAQLKKEKDNAEEFYRYAISSDKTSSSAYYALATLLNEQGSIDEAADNFYQSIVLDADQENAYEPLLNYWLDQEMFDSIENFFPVQLNKMKDKSTKITAHLLLGWYYSQSKKETPENGKQKSLSHLENLLQLGYSDKKELDSYFKKLKGDKDYVSLLVKYAENK